MNLRGTMRFLTFIFVIFLIHTGCYAQSDIKDNVAIATLKKFYIAHNTIESSIKSLPPNIYVQKSDSLLKQYCTLQLVKTAKKHFANGFDLLTYDHGIDSRSLKTMSIVRDSTNKNIYIVSYDVLDNNYPNKPVLNHVILHVGIVIEGEQYKIASVK